MNNNKLYKGVTLIEVMVAAIMAFSATRRVTLITYYPAPYGKYNDLQSKTLTVSDKVGIGTINPGSRLQVGTPGMNGREYMQTAKQADIWV